MQCAHSLLPVRLATQQSPLFLFLLVQIHVLLDTIGANPPIHQLQAHVEKTLRCHSLKLCASFLSITTFGLRLACLLLCSLHCQHVNLSCSAELLSYPPTYSLGTQLLFVEFGLGLGAFNTLATIINQLTTPFGYDDACSPTSLETTNCKTYPEVFLLIQQTQSGILGFLVVFCGIIGAGVESALVDYTRRHFPTAPVLLPRISLELFPTDTNCSSSARFFVRPVCFLFFLLLRHLIFY